MSKSMTELLTEARLFTPQNQEAIQRLGDRDRIDPLRLEISCSNLKRAGLLTQNNFEIAAASARSKLSYTLAILYDAKLLTQENFELAAANENLYLGECLNMLQKAELLTQENFELVVTCTGFYLSHVLELIIQSGIFTSNNFVLIAAHPDPYELDDTLSSLKEADILTQVNFDALLAPNHMALVSEDAIELVWDRIPVHFLTQENFQRLIIAAERANPMKELGRVTNEILGIAPVMAGAGGPGGGAGMGLFAESDDCEEQAARGHKRVRTG